MQNNNNFDSFYRLVSTIKKIKSIKRKLNLLVRYMPVFFWQRENLIEILGSFGFIGFFKISEIYKLRGKAEYASLFVIKFFHLVDTRSIILICFLMQIEKARDDETKIKEKATSNEKKYLEQNHLLFCLMKKKKKKIKAMI